MKNLFYIVMILCCWLLIVVKGLEHFKSLLSNTYGCLERTNVTVLIPDNHPKHHLDEINELMEHLKNPCNTFFIFANNLRKVIQMKGIEMDLMIYNQKTLSNTEIVRFIEELQDQNSVDVIVKQILLIVQDSWSWSLSKNDVLKKLERLDKKSNWNVIINCEMKYCPISHHIPIKQIVPIWRRAFLTYRKELIDIVRNPTFSEIEYLKHVKLDDVRIKCLKNKTIHIGLHHYSLKLLENIALLIYNTQELSTKIVLYDKDFEFLEHFLKMNGLKDYKHFSTVFGDLNAIKFYEPLTHNTDDIYFIGEDNSLFKYIICHGSFQGRKSFVIFSEKTAPIDKTCRDKLERITFKYFVDGDLNLVLKDLELFHNDFIKEVLNISCF